MQRYSEEEMQKAFSMLVEYREQFDEPGEPTYVETFFKNKDGSWSTWLDTVDREMLADLVELEVLHALDGADRLRPVHLVGKEDNRHILEVYVVQQRQELVSRDAHPDFVRRVHREDDAAAVLVVVLPQVAVPSLARHVEDGEAEVVLRERLHRKADRRHNVLLNRLRAPPRDTHTQITSAASTRRARGTWPARAPSLEKRRRFFSELGCTLLI